MKRLQKAVHRKEANVSAEKQDFEESRRSLEALLKELKREIEALEDPHRSSLEIEQPRVQINRYQNKAPQTLTGRNLSAGKQPITYSNPYTDLPPKEDHQRSADSRSSNRSRQSRVHNLSTQQPHSRNPPLPTTNEPLYRSNDAAQPHLLEREKELIVALRQRVRVLEGERDSLRELAESI